MSMCTESGIKIYANETKYNKALSRQIQVNKF